MPLSARPIRAALGGLSLLALLAGCTEPLDYDLRGNFGAFSTTDAAMAATTDRPAPDERGIIAYPNYQVAVARRGDRVTDVAERIGMNPGELARYNGMEVDTRLRGGEVLALPRRVAEPRAPVDIASVAGQAIDAAPDTTPVATTTLEPAAPAAVEARARPAPPSGPEPVRHKVKRGETAYTISRLYQVPVKALAEWNGLGPDFAIREGQYLLIPVKDGSPPAQIERAAAPVSAPGTGSPTPTPPSATAPLPEEKVAAEAPEPPKVDPGPQTEASRARMGMPVKGSIVRDYEKGKNEGLDIAGAPGAPVVAAEDGTVAAITSDADQVPIVVVRHDKNLLTVYANVDGIKVEKGDTVRRGQQLASLRDGDKAYLHFEVREGFDSVDPSPYLK